MTKSGYTAVVKQQGEVWFGWIEEIPGVDCHATSREALLDSLRIELRQAIDFCRHNAISSAGKNHEKLVIAV